ncbi:alpha-L-glutamate ligase-like protein [Catenovulum sp. 2E275]|uniref:alpha-L-glutamate ligase-like protein n=1 Tax=Catenovulum sp. 2E275 TaxID=2980497 RepID=UPI0021D3C754|nr:alpha-L-glutamate ligase-like protein [Catenovulum sp. 2E275]MCU4676297.1 alpha-L-glutamate ligase-like protein [Catenovulum sp. 2E275]
MRITDWLANPFKLHALGILGMNERNSRYIAQYNDRHLYPLVDDKLKTKKLMLDAEIKVPGLIATIMHQSQVQQLLKHLPLNRGFAIKPAKGSGGKGILVIINQHDGLYVKTNQKLLNLEQLQHHCSNILAGLYSLGGNPDVAIIEELIEFDPMFDGFSHEGVPDIRVIIFRGYPVMAMMRLSTKDSDGKANLHQGAVGVGLDIRTGNALHAVQFGQPIVEHPDTHRALSELSVPNWKELLILASRCYDETQLGYLGTDIVLDKNLGALVLELNARPGLSIQVANGCGLKPRLKQIERIQHKRNALHRVEYAQKHFASKPDFDEVAEVIENS